MSAGYEGRCGELWLARVLPPPAASMDDAVVFATSYVIETGPAAWQACLAPSLPKIGADPWTAYQRLMKRGLDERFWFEYVFEAYAHRQPEAVFLRGLPDLPESRPHGESREPRHQRLG